LNLWLKTDSSLVVQVFKSTNLIPWLVRNRWNNVMIMLRNMNCIVTHIYREGNQVADSLADFGLTSDHFIFWDDTPWFTRKSYIINKIGLPILDSLPFEGV